MIPGLPPFDAHDNFWNMVPEWRESYVGIKYRVANTFKPKRICEIGVYSCIAAKCFMAASPQAEYIGIDNLHEQMVRKINITNDSIRHMREMGYNATLIVADSQELKELPGQFDFIHVDGDHSRKGAYHDIWLAWEALTPDGHLLIDNGHDMGVASGVFDAMYEIMQRQQKRGENYLVDWRYMPDSAGDILIYRKFL